MHVARRVVWIRQRIPYDAEPESGGPYPTWSVLPAEWPWCRKKRRAALYDRELALPHTLTGCSRRRWTYALLGSAAVTCPSSTRALPVALPVALAWVRARVHTRLGECRGSIYNPL